MIAYTLDQLIVLSDAMGMIASADAMWLRRYFPTLAVYYTSEPRDAAPEYARRRPLPAYTGKTLRFYNYTPLEELPEPGSTGSARGNDASTFESESAYLVLRDQMAERRG